MKLCEYLKRAEELKKEISVCGNLIQLYTEKEKNLQEEYLRMMDIEYVPVIETNKASDCETPKVKELRDRIEILEEAVENYNLWRCKKCGHYSMPDFVCHNCGYDRSEPEDENE